MVKIPNHRPSLGTLAKRVGKNLKDQTVSNVKSRIRYALTGGIGNSGIGDLFRPTSDEQNDSSTGSSFLDSVLTSAVNNMYMDDLVFGDPQTYEQLDPMEGETAQVIKSIERNIGLLDRKTRALDNAIASNARILKDNQNSLKQTQSIVQDAIREMSHDRFKRIENEMEMKVELEEQIKRAVADEVARQNELNNSSLQTPSVLDNMLNAIFSLGSNAAVGAGIGVAGGVAGAGLTSAGRAGIAALGGAGSSLLRLLGPVGVAAAVLAPTEVGNAELPQDTSGLITDPNDPRLKSPNSGNVNPQQQVDAGQINYENLISDLDNSRLTESENFLGEYQRFELYADRFFAHSQNIGFDARSELDMQAGGPIRISSGTSITLSAPLIEIIGNLKLSSLDEAGSNAGGSAGAGGFKRGAGGEKFYPGSFDPKTGRPIAGISGGGGDTGTLIARGESGAAGYNAYNTGSAGRTGKPLDLAGMTIGEIMQMQSSGKVFAVGKYQITTNTMREAVKALGLDPNQKFDASMQERIYRDYLIDERRPAIRDYITGKSNDINAATLAMSQEFAAVADPHTGKSHYDGIAGNSSSISATEMQSALDREKAAYDSNIKSGMSPEEAWLGISGKVNEMKEAGSDSVAGGTKRVRQLQGTHARIRKGDLDSNFSNTLELTAQELSESTGRNIEFEVTSGGQRMHGAPGATGTHEHDDGMAGDFNMVEILPNGEKRVLDPRKKEDAVIINKGVEIFAGNGGRSAGAQYMGDPTKLHFGVSRNNPAAYAGSKDFKESFNSGRGNYIEEASQNGWNQRDGYIDLYQKEQKAREEAARARSAQATGAKENTVPEGYLDKNNIVTGNSDNNIVEISVGDPSKSSDASEVIKKEMDRQKSDSMLAPVEQVSAMKKQKNSHDGVNMSSMDLMMYAETAIV